MNIAVKSFCSETSGEELSTLEDIKRMMEKMTFWVQSQEEDEEQYDSLDLSVSQRQQAVVVEVGRDESGSIQEEEDRGWRAAQMEEWRIKEAEEEKKAGNSRYEL